MKRILVVGDLIIDRYITIQPKSLSPEAPVILADVTSIEDRLGGAGNVLHNIYRMIEQVNTPIDITYIGIISDEIYKILEKEKLTHLFPSLTSTKERRVRKVSIKNRVVCINPYRQFLRFDQDYILKYNDSFRLSIEDTFSKLEENYDIAIVSDYNKGAIDSWLFQLVRSKSKLLITDPKKKDPLFYKGTDIITPNIKEFESFSARESSLSTTEKLNLLSNVILKCDVILKEGSEGYTLSSNKKISKFKAHNAGSFVDPSGAGDTFIAALAFYLVLGMTIQEAASNANIAAGRSVTRPGCYVIEDGDI